jgi:hypothetical protein
MLNMKKLITIAAALLLGFAAHAQVFTTAGYLFEWSPNRFEGKKNFVSEMHGVYVGGAYNYVLTSFGLGVAGGTYVSVSSGTDFIPGYGKDVKRDGQYVVREGHRHVAITIPAYVTYTMNLGPGSLFAYAGAAFQGGLVFQSYTKTNFEGNHYYPNVFNLRYRDHHRPCDVKVSFGAGYRWKFLAADFGFDFGLIDRDPAYDFSYRIHSFHMGVSYVF